MFGSIWVGDGETPGDGKDAGICIPGILISIFPGEEVGEADGLGEGIGAGISMPGIVAMSSCFDVDVGFFFFGVGVGFGFGLDMSIPGMSGWLCPQAGAIAKQILAAARNTPAIAGELILNEINCFIIPLETGYAKK